MLRQITKIVLFILVGIPLILSMYDLLKGKKRRKVILKIIRTLLIIGAIIIFIVN